MEDESFVSGLVKPEDAEEEEEEGEEPGKETTIISAASNGSVDRLKELLADGADVNGARQGDHDYLGRVQRFGRSSQGTACRWGGCERGGRGGQDGAPLECRVLGD